MSQLKMLKQVKDIEPIKLLEIGLKIDFKKEKLNLNNNLNLKKLKSVLMNTQNKNYIKLF